VAIDFEIRAHRFRQPIVETKEVAIEARKFQIEMEANIADRKRDFALTEPSYVP